MDAKSLEEQFEKLKAWIAERELGQEFLPLSTNVHIELRDKDGNLKDERNIHNIVCTAGKNKILTASGGSLLNSFSYIAIGTGTTAVAIGDTALQTEVARSNGTTSNPNASTWQTTFTFAAGIGTGAITESGLLDAASVGSLLAHQTFTAVNKGASDTLAVTWQFT